MAEEVNVAGARMKIRSPWGTFALSLVTLGIYYCVWYYKINRELRDYGIGKSPWTSLLAFTLGGLIIVPPFVSIWNTCGRIKQAEERAGVAEPINEGIGLVLYLIAAFFLPFEIVYLQDHMNKTWRAAASQPRVA